MCIRDRVGSPTACVAKDRQPRRSAAGRSMVDWTPTRATKVAGFPTLSWQPLLQPIQRQLDLVHRDAGEEAHERAAADRIEVDAGRERDARLLQHLVAPLQARARVAGNVGVDIEPVSYTH